MPFDLRCRCAGYSTRWIEQQPGDIHRYKVQCANCRKFVAWGTEARLLEHGANFDITLVTWVDQQAKPTLDRFFS